MEHTLNLILFIGLLLVAGYFIMGFVTGRSVKSNEAFFRDSDPSRNLKDINLQADMQQGQQPPQPQHQTPPPPAASSPPQDEQPHFGKKPPHPPEG